MSKTFWLCACVALGKLSCALGPLTWKTRRMPVVRRIMAWVAVRIGLLTWHLCSKGMDRKETVAREACLEAARAVVERISEEELDALEARIEDPAIVAALAKKCPGLPDVGFFMDAVKREIRRRKEATKPGAPLSGP